MGLHRIYRRQGELPAALGLEDLKGAWYRLQKACPVVLVLQLCLGVTFPKPQKHQEQEEYG